MKTLSFLYSIHNDDDCMEFTEIASFVVLIGEHPGFVLVSYPIYNVIVHTKYLSIICACGTFIYVLFMFLSVLLHKVRSFNHMCFIRTHGLLEFL